MTGPNNPSAPRRDYEIGYGKPPKATQFKPGQSGNPKGRKKQPKTIQSELRRLLSKKIPITERGRTRNMPVQEVILRTLIQKAAKGDLRTASFVFKLMEASESDNANSLDAVELQAEDKDLLDSIIAELLGDDGHAVSS